MVSETHRICPASFAKHMNISNPPSCIGSAGLDSLRQMVLSREHQQDVGIARISREDSGVWNGLLALGIQSHCRMMIGVSFITSKTERYLGSMKPFSGSVSQDP